MSNPPGYAKAKKLIMVKTPNGKIVQLARNTREELLSAMESDSSKTAHPAPAETPKK